MCYALQELDKFLVVSGWEKVDKIFNVIVRFVQNPNMTISLLVIEVMMVLVLALVTLLVVFPALICRVRLWLTMATPLTSLSLAYP